MTQKPLFEEKYGTTPALRDFLPDWKDDSQYKFPATMSSQLWAWQFLRRNSHYRSLWGTYFYEMFRNDPDLLEGAKSIAPVKSDDGSIVFHSPDKRLAESCDIAKIFYRLFGVLNFPPSPAENFPKIKFAVPGTRESLPKGAYEKMSELKGSGVKVTYVFNLDVPIDPQIKTAKKFLEEKRKKMGIRGFRMRPDKYPAYLRILDAKLHYQKTNAIAKVVFPTLANSSDYDRQHSAIQNVRDNFKAARILRDRDYRLMAVCRNKK